MGRALLYGMPFAVMWGAVVGKLLALRHDPRNPRLRCYWLALLALALAVTVLRAPWHPLGSAPAVEQVTRVIGHSLVLVSAFFVQAFLFFAVHPEAARPRVQRRASALAATVTVMVTMYLLGPREPLEFVGRVELASSVIAYWSAFHLYLGVALVDLVRLNRQWSQQAEQPVFRLGLRLTAVGGLFGLAEVAYSLLFLAASELGWPPRHLLGDQPAVTQVLLAVTVLLTVGGSTMTAWGPRVGLPKLLAWVDQYRAYRRLYPLWRELCETVPDVLLVRPWSRWRDVLTVRHLDVWLSRRIMEIRDAGLVLRRYFDPQVAVVAEELGRQAKLNDEERAAVVEAASLAAAVHFAAVAAAVGERPGSHPGDPPLALRLGPGDQTATGEQAPHALKGEDPERERAWLMRVANAYTRSPLVPAILARQAQGTTVRG